VRITLVLVAFRLASLESFAQGRHIEVGAHLGWVDLGELDTTDLGVGGRFSFRPTSIFAIEAELSYFPSDVPEEVPVTNSRLEGLFGVKAGHRFDRFTIFGKLRPGFVRFAEAPRPIACIAIFPPPLSCVLAGGKTVFALDAGGGVEFYLSERSLVRADVSSLLLRYPGPLLNKAGEAFIEEAFWTGSLRLTFGAGLRF
jgi:hypothetical protein